MALRRLGGRAWMRRLNLILGGVLISIPVAYVIVALATGARAFDYGTTLYAADLFCYQPDAFGYTAALNTFYPAPFYTTFCWPHRYIEPLLYIVWLLAPVGLMLWLARGRALALTYPPLADTVLLGQNTWLLLPLFALGDAHERGQRVPWWHGLIAALGVLKPHIAFPVWIWLGWRWRGQWRVYAAWALGTLGLLLPGFLLRPGWLGEWLSNSIQGRGTLAAIGRASVALVPDRLGFSTVVIYLFCGVVALLVYGLLRWRRGKLDFYDWTLLFVFASPMLNAYDLIVLVPFLVRRRRRMWLALAPGSRRGPSRSPRRASA